MRTVPARFISRGVCVTAPRPPQAPSCGEPRPLCLLLCGQMSGPFPFPGCSTHAAVNVRGRGFARPRVFLCPAERGCSVLCWLPGGSSGAARFSLGLRFPSWKGEQCPGTCCFAGPVMRVTWRLSRAEWWPLLLFPRPSGEGRAGRPSALGTDPWHMSGCQVFLGNLLGIWERFLQSPVP